MTLIGTSESGRGRVLKSALSCLRVLAEMRAIVEEAAELKRFDGQPSDLARRARAILDDMRKRDG